jgi:hypothetical protein
MYFDYGYEWLLVIERIMDGESASWLFVLQHLSLTNIGDI